MSGCLFLSGSGSPVNFYKSLNRDQIKERCYSEEESLSLLVNFMFLNHKEA